MADFASIIKRLRLERGITQEQLASMLKVSRSTIGMYETGSREPDFETCEAIADIFNVDMDYLIGRSTVERKDPIVPMPKHEVTDEDIKFALFDGGPVTDAQFAEVKQFVRFIKERDANAGKN